MLITKSEDVTKQGFCKVLWRKLRLREGLLLSLIGVLWEGVGWGWAIIRGWALITFSAFRMGAYSRWALIRGWALNRIHTVSVSRDLSHPFLTFYFNPNLHHFINNTCNLIHFLSMTFDTKFMELIGVFLAVSITSIILSLPHFYHYRHNIFELNHSCLQYVKDDLFLQVFVE